ncbi:hypothetical protein [Serratia entomophila]|uniref:hypothetical protein n=2 Tax=Serratia entomophila TaxID=42906 RepID=UPI003617A080
MNTENIKIMQLPQLVNMFGADLQRRYGEKIHKLGLHGEQPALAPLWCENRWSGMQAVGGYLRHHGGQGSALEEKLRYRP